MSEDIVFTGVPTMCLLPLNNTRFKIVGKTQINLPRSGNYDEIAPDIFSDEDDSFDLLTPSNLLNIPSITKVLLATDKYPKLGPNQIFVPSTFLFEEANLIIDGMVLEILSIVQ